MEVTIPANEFWNGVEKLIEAAAAVCPVTGESDARNAMACVLSGFIGVSPGEYEIEREAIAV